MAVVGLICAGLTRLEGTDYCFSVAQIESNAIGGPFIALVVFEVVFCVVHVMFVPAWESNWAVQLRQAHPVCELLSDVSYCALTGLLAAQFFVCSKIALELLDMTFDGNNQLNTPRFWVCIMMGVVFVLLDLHTCKMTSLMICTYNIYVVDALAVRKDDIVVVFPTYSCYTITFTMLQGVLLLGEADGNGIIGTVMIICSIGLFACAIPLLHRGSKSVPIVAPETQVVVPLDASEKSEVDDSAHVENPPHVENNHENNN